MSDGHHDNQDCLTREDAKLIVRETLIQMGVDMDEPIEFQADCHFVRKTRKIHESIGKRIINTAVGVFVTGSIALVVMGVGSWFRKGG